VKRRDEKARGGSCVPTRRGLPRPQIRGGGEGRPHSLLRPRNPAMDWQLMTAFYPYARENHQLVPSRQVSSWYLGGLSFSSLSVLPTLTMHPQTPHRTASPRGSSGSPRSPQDEERHGLNPNGYSPKSLSSEGQTVFSGGTSSEGHGGAAETTQDNPNGRRAAGSGQRVADRSRPDRP
jgi:hypothetical protein